MGILEVFRNAAERAVREGVSQVTSRTRVEVEKNAASTIRDGIKSYLDGAKEKANNSEANEALDKLKDLIDDAAAKNTLPFGSFFCCFPSIDKYNIYE